MTKKILIVNPFGIGDVIFSEPLIEVLKNSFPGCFIGYICNRRVSELIGTNPFLNKVFVYEKDEYRSAWKRSKIEGIKKILTFLKEIKRERFDVSIDLSLGYKHSLFMKLAGIKNRIGLNYKDRGKFLTGKVDIESFDNKHVVDYYLDLVKPLSINIEKVVVAPKLFASQSGKDFADRFLSENSILKSDILIGILPGCGASWGVDAQKRRWNAEKFAILADKLIEQYGAKIVLLGDSKETEVASRVKSMMKNRVINYCGKTSVGELVGLLAKCKFIVTNEGGPLHMAVALGIGTVSIFGPVDEKSYGPYFVKGSHIVVARKDLPCRPCYKKFKYNDCNKQLCLETITVDEVFEAAEKVLTR